MPDEQISIREALRQWLKQVKAANTLDAEAIVDHAALMGRYQNGEAVLPALRRSSLAWAEAAGEARRALRRIHAPACLPAEGRYLAEVAMDAGAAMFRERARTAEVEASLLDVVEVFGQHVADVPLDSFPAVGAKVQESLQMIQGFQALAASYLAQSEQAYAMIVQGWGLLDDALLSESNTLVTPCNADVTPDGEAP